MVTVQQHNHDDTIKKGYYCCSSFSSSQSSVISSTSVSSILHGFRHSYSVHPHISVHAMPLFLQLQFFSQPFLQLHFTRFITAFGAGEFNVNTYSLSHSLEGNMRYICRVILFSILARAFRRGSILKIK